MSHIEWVLCPVCGSKTRLRIRSNTILENFPLFCPKCKHETFNRSSTTKSIHRARARRQDAEPIARRLSVVDTGSFLI